MEKAGPALKILAILPISPYNAVSPTVIENKS
jgi:hypothetical protein